MNEERKKTLNQHTHTKEMKWKKKKIPIPSCGTWTFNAHHDACACVCVSIESSCYEYCCVRIYFYGAMVCWTACVHAPSQPTIVCLCMRPGSVLFSDFLHTNRTSVRLSQAHFEWVAVSDTCCVEFIYLYTVTLSAPRFTSVTLVPIISFVSFPLVHSHTQLSFSLNMGSVRLLFFLVCFGTFILCYVSVRLFRGSLTLLTIATRVNFEHCQVVCTLSSSTFFGYVLDEKNG